MCNRAGAEVAADADGTIQHSGLSAMHGGLAGALTVVPVSSKIVMSSETQFLSVAMKTAGLGPATLKVTCGDMSRTLAE